MPVRLVHATANRPGAIAILQLIGECEPILRAITGVDDWPLHRVRLVDFAGIDQGLAVRVTPNIAQLMPHGGPRVMQRLTARLIELGAPIQVDPAESVDPQALFPESKDRCDALMMLALAKAHSPMAIDLLLDQPRRWREFHRSHARLTSEDRERSHRLNRLIDPPVVVLAGRPNVGKSTLSNALLGRAMSIAHEMPGTTIDYTAGRIDLGGLAVDWHDTPGLRATDDPIERKAVELARRLMDRADLLIAMTAPAPAPAPGSAPAPSSASHWPQLPRVCDLRVLNKSDLLTRSARSGLPQDVIAISAKTGDGLATLVASVREALLPSADLSHSGPWLFDDRLIDAMRGP